MLAIELFKFWGMMFMMKSLTSKIFCITSLFVDFLWFVCLWINPWHTLCAWLITSLIIFPLGMYIAWWERDYQLDFDINILKTLMNGVFPVSFLFL